MLTSEGNLKKSITISTIIEDTGNKHCPEGPLGLNPDSVFFPCTQTDSSFRLKKIESCKYNGLDRRVIARIAPHHPFGLGVFENHLYYTDWFKFGKGIKKLNKFTGGEKQKIKPTLWSHMDIQVYHPLRQPNGKSSCNHPQPHFL